MRILMLAQSYAPVIGGEERIVEDLSAELVRRGHEVGVATLRQPAGAPPEKGDGVAVHLLGDAMHRLPGAPGDGERRYAPPAPDPVTVRDLRRLVDRERPDVVHAHNWLVDSYLPIARRSDPAFVLSLHDYGLICPTKRLFYRGEVCSGPALGKCLGHAAGHYGAAKGTLVTLGTRFSEPRLRSRVDMFLSISSAVGELNRIGADQPHRVIPNFIGKLPAPPAADRLSGLPDGPFVLFFGDASEDKGARHLVETYATLEGAPPLVLIGRIVEEDLTAGSDAIALGPMPHEAAIEALRRSLFAVVPSLWAEPFGIVALETAAAGKAIVASDVGGLRDVVADGETGLLVPAGDAPALRSALERMLADAEMRAKMGEAAARRAKLFGAEEVVPQFEEAYRLAIDARLKRKARRGR